jgi:hypothetical protein
MIVAARPCHRLLKPLNDPLPYGAVLLYCRFLAATDTLAILFAVFFCFMLLAQINVIGFSISRQ